MANQKLLMHLTFIAFLFYGCDVKNNKEYRLLILKNKVLEDENERLKANINSLSIRPIVIPKSTSIKLGEEYIADVRLAMVDINSPPLTILCRFDNVANKLMPIGDTLKYNKDYESSTYRHTPTAKGLYQWAGIIFQKLDNKNLEYGFTAVYDVK